MELFMKLYEISAKIKELCNNVENAEDINAVYDVMRDTKLDFNDKVESCVFVIKEIEGIIEARKTLINAVKEHIQAMENKKQWLSDYVLLNMKEIGIDKINGDYFTVKPVKNPPKVTIFDESLIPEKFKKIKTEIVIDKTAIKESIKSGIPVDGAIMERGERLYIK